METYFHFLQKTYNDIIAGALLAQDSYNCAALLNPSFFSSAKNCELCACHFFRKLDAQVSSSLDPINNEHDISKNISHLKCHAREIILLQLTLIEMMLAKLHLQEVAPEIKRKYIEILRILQESNLASELIHLLRSSDKPLSHMASKSLASLVHFQLREENSLNSAWLAFCLETLSGFPSNSSIAECLWTLTNIIKEMLNDDNTCKEGDLKKLLTPLNNVLENFYSSILSYYSSAHSAPLSAKSTNDMNSFLDLFELLVASRIQVPLNLGCQRVLFLNSCGIGCLATSPVHGFIKKKSIALLKNCILHKAGEDLIKTKALPSSSRDPYLDNDRLALADTVLHFVNSDWLGRLCVSGNTRHFDGSTIEPQAQVKGNFDIVLFRSLSLLLLKALETKIQDFAYKSESPVHLESVMGLLFTVLKSHLKPSTSVCLLQHPCMWISLFIEQDDEMVEAVKSLLTIYLNLERFCPDVHFTLCRSDERTQDNRTHQNGYNPHCLFLCLLGSVAFDATVLLDFLISSETCFLEYFVQYLKLLVEDWHQFVQVSKCFKFTVGKDLRIWEENMSCQQGKVPNSDLTGQSTAYDTQPCTEALNLSTLCQGDSQAMQLSHFDFVTSSSDSHLSGAFQKLVDYDSSEDSDVECIREERLADTEQEASNHRACPNKAVLDEKAKTSKQEGLLFTEQDLNISSDSGSKLSPPEFKLADETFQKATACFQQLQKSISRLHAKRLFPYNPNALLKLLSQVHIISEDH
ncbi:protein Lines homolog 1 [Ahaetulla prasina]|uniref:protein Lines homolog 1 n=1 Tax=Ahaetulla prasina TaxID=499056 RepID=UPI0026473EAE|nr:protein Lines homolog 1 [Ahaetulla prasina]XP_058012778.1 protein Lines homolog 1 [Ahaetulla prasina]XP_058012779.1 protein Lines homolog 1 [Ahaetulla prasina]